MGARGGVIERGETTVWAVRGGAEERSAEWQNSWSRAGFIAAPHEMGTGGVEEGKGESLSNHRQCWNWENWDVSVTFSALTATSTSYI